jgi:hypothetical protein
LPTAAVAELVGHGSAVAILRSHGHASTTAAESAAIPAGNLIALPQQTAMEHLPNVAKVFAARTQHVTAFGLSR